MVTMQPGKPARSVRRSYLRANRASLRPPQQLEWRTLASGAAPVRWQRSPQQAAVGAIIGGEVICARSRARPPALSAPAARRTASRGTRRGRHPAHAGRGATGQSPLNNRQPNSSTKVAASSLVRTTARHTSSAAPAPFRRPSSASRANASPLHGPCTRLTITTSFKPTRAQRRTAAGN